MDHNKTEYLVIGNGGHAKVVIDTIHAIGGRVVAVYCNDSEYDPKVSPLAQVIIAVGSNEKRMEISKSIKHAFATLIHPNAVVAPSAIIAEGSIVLANAVVQAYVKIGCHVIVEPNVTIDHDAEIGNFSLIYPGVYIGGGATVSPLKTVDANMIIKRNMVY